jgi:translation initiation factor 4E
MNCGSTLYSPPPPLHRCIVDYADLAQMLAAIGETLEKEGDDEVMGVVVNARKGFYRIGLWTKSCTNQEVLKAIGYLSPPLLQLW